MDINGDGTIADVPDDPNTPQDETLVETAIPWCFAYGEDDWVNPGFTVPVRGGGARDARFSDYLNRARSNTTYRVNCQ